MDYDLKIIKEKYGERMMHLCRQLFPTILETEGLLSSLLLKTFEPSRLLYDDIMEENFIDGLDDSQNSVEWFKNFIFDLFQKKDLEVKDVEKSPKQLLEEVGYLLFECKSEADIQKFKKYYALGEELCTFNGGRLDKCHVFFAIKKNIDEIKRENFLNPDRQDEYGTSIISIQFSRGTTNTLSIKNRYNHTVYNCDSTFSNNLENIIEGLTKSFEREYKLNIIQNFSDGFALKNYVKANDGKYYPYNYEINNVYYCPNNIIIDNFEVKKFPKERYIVLDYFIIDLSTKKIRLYDKSINDSFLDALWNINIINVIKKTNNKEIELVTRSGQKIIIEINNRNQIVTYKNEYLVTVRDNFLQYNRYMQKLYLPKLKKTGNNFLRNNEGRYANRINSTLPSLTKVGSNIVESLDLPSLKVASKWSGYQYGNVKAPIFDKCPLDKDSFLIVGIRKAEKNITKLIKELISLAYKLQYERKRKKYERLSNTPTKKQ